MDIAINFFIFPEHIQDVEKFNENYDLVELLVCPDEPNRNWTPKNERVCRFCGKDYKNTTFRQDSHLIPEFLGNKYLILQDECDQCNALFSDYESNLSAYLGPSVSLFATKGKKNKVPKFKDHKNNLSIEEEEFYGNNVIGLKSDKSLGLDINKETGLVKIRFKRDNYVPIKVYKAFLKFAVSLLPIEDLENYKIAISALLSEKFDIGVSAIAIVKEHWLPQKLDKPRAFLFKKKEKDNRLPSHVFKLYFGMLMYEFFIPFNKEDNIYDGKPFPFIACPPVFDVDLKNKKYCSYDKNLGSTSEVIKEDSELFFNINPENLKNIYSYNPNTKESKPSELNPDDIVRMVLSYEEFKIDLKNQSK